MFEWSFTIHGRPASKKNSRRNFGRVSLPSVAYEKFLESALEQLDGNTPKQPYSGNVELTLHLYLKGRLRQDIDNACASINDVLQEAGVIVDDNQVVVAHLYKHQGAKDWKSEIVLKSVD